MEIKRIALKLLVANTGQVPGLPTNPRTWTKDEVSRLARSIKETPELLEARGIMVMPLPDGKYIILGGNMRYEALKELKEKDAPCVVFPPDIPAEKLRELVIKDNGAFGSWNNELLVNEWRDCELDEWGVREWQPEAEMGESFVSDVTVEEDEFDEEVDVVVPVTQRGDMFQLGDHVLMCGDSTSQKDIDTLMQGNKANLWLTHPPYNVAIVGGNRMEDEEIRLKKGFLKIKNDKMDNDDFYKFLSSAFACAESVMEDGASFYVWYASREHINFETALASCGLAVREQLIWVKNSFLLSRQDYHWRHEPCLYGWKEGKAHNWYTDRKQSTVLEFNRPTKSDLHPTMKPLDLFGYLVQNSSRDGEIVLDTFGGSGTTLIVCENLKRKCRMMELDEHFCDVIIARWEKLTGKKAVKIVSLNEDANNNISNN